MVDLELRRLGLRGFQAVLALELEGELGESERARLAQAFGDLLSNERRGRARVARLFGLGPLVFAPRPDPTVPFRARATCAPDLLAFAKERLEAPLDPRRDPLIDLELEVPKGATRLALRWWHPAMDERGAELLLRTHSCPNAARPVSPASRGPDTVPAASVPDRWRKLWAEARAARAVLAELTERAPFVLPAPVRAATADAAWVVDVERLSPEDTARLVAACDDEYGPRAEGLAQAGLVFSALAELAPSESELSLPATIQLRPPRAPGPIAGNALSFLWYSVRTAVARDRAALAEALRSAARSKVAAGEELRVLALLELGRLLPMPLYRRELRRRDGAPRFSISISTLGELFGGARELFGRPLRDALALTTFPAPPGIGVLFSRAAGSLRIATLHAPALVDSGEARRLHEQIVARALSSRAR
jgi:hypothetical protein